ncbi:hypothetical protein PPL_00556 [Heterostelium album PN500]|uniref:Uncharacterized protein n=1 Tax=Heterostelium pallidum (strain ATCC 26659 / Pp 5 / PN500) TaxID=670386 RepID=D3AWS8_HETP5|nr:hypothetical protein PPL_00556 [Heterostelium album PN500]EFA86751.1 hypothetical protein PPL_00556 [Heterostelium album PN500]|eukprot:XP_020438855.1 hypothetical protein PPL_00556 [Heterostelium album PN500]
MNTLENSTNNKTIDDAITNNGSNSSRDKSLIDQPQNNNDISNNNSNNNGSNINTTNNNNARSSFLNLLIFDKLSPKKQQQQSDDKNNNNNNDIVARCNNNNNKNELDEIIIQKDIIRDLGEIADRSESKLGLLTTENQRLNDNYQKVLKENESLIEITNTLDKRVDELCKELSYHKDNSIESIIDKIKNNVTPTGIDSIRSIQDKEQLLNYATQLYQEEFNEDVLFKVIMFLKTTLNWKLFINQLRGHYDSLEYYVGYLKQTNNIEDLIKLYREIRNPLEEGIAMISQAHSENDPDRLKYLLYSCSSFFDQYHHLTWYKDTIDQFINTRNELSS